jgi:hypothetical protein
LLAKPNLATEFLYGLRFDRSILGSMQRGQEPFRIPGRSKQMGGLSDACELGSSNEYDIFITASINDNDFAIVCDFITEFCKIGARVGVCRLDWHGKSPRLMVLYRINVQKLISRVKRFYGTFISTRADFQRRSDVG